MRIGVVLPRKLAALGAVSALAWTINLLGHAYVARTISSTGLGLLVFGLSVAAYASVIAAPGLNVWGIRAVSRDREAAGKFLSIVNGSQLVLGAVAYIIVLAVAMTGLTEQHRLIVIVAGIGVFSAFAGTQWLCQALERYDMLAASLLQTALLTLAGFVLFVHGPGDVYVVPVVMLTAQLIASCVTVVWLRGASLIRFTSVSMYQVLDALRTSSALGVAPIVITVFHNANTLLLQASHGSAAVGFFSSGFRLVEMLALVPTLVTSLFFPRLSRFAGASEPWNATMRSFVSVTMSLAFFPAALLLVEAESVTSILYGPEYAQAAPVVRVMGVAVLFNFAAIAYLMAVLAAHHDREYVVALAATAVFSVGAGFAVVPSIGLMGATVVVSMLDLVAWLFTLPVLGQLSRDRFLTEWTRPAVGGAVVVALLLIAAAASMPFLVRAGIAGSVYAALVFVRNDVAEIVVTADNR
jgi:O-antigen/teichoic acid export membrane protein